MAANSNPLPNPNEKLVRVLETEQEAEALIVKGLLESADIECDLMSIDFPQDVLPMGGVALLVREEDETRAKQLIQEYRRTPVQETEEDAAEEVSEEPEAKG